MTSTSRFRIPEAPITGRYGVLVKRYAKRAFGELPDGASVSRRRPGAVRSGA